MSRRKESLVEWDAWFCVDPSCPHKVWLARRSAEQPEVWWVTRRCDERPWTVAAATPLCPWCGAWLLTAIQYVTEAHEQRAGVGARRPLGLA